MALPTKTTEPGRGERTVRRGAIAVAAATVCLMLTSCGSSANEGAPVPETLPTSSSTPTPTPTRAPEPDPVLLPGGTALANRAYFDFVNKKLLAANPNPSSEEIVANLEGAGFAKGDLEVTADSTAVISRPADSIQVAVRTSDGCLLGQFQAGGYSSTVGPELNGGACLIGETEPIR